MPCYDHDRTTDYHLEQALRERAERAEAIACAVLSGVEKCGLKDQVFEVIDWRESGLSVQSVSSWWAEHKEADEDRRRLEAQHLKQKEEQERKRQEALAKLTPEEQKLLGVRK